MTTNLPHRHGLYYVIPAQVMDDESISPAQKLLYALLSGLADHEGKCFPSDEYLCKRLNESESVLKRNLRGLEQYGFIKRHTAKDSHDRFKTVRIIEIVTCFKQPKSRPPEPLEGVKNDPLGAPNLAYIESEVPLVSEEENRHGGQKPPARVSPVMPRKIKRAEHIETTDDEHERLLADLGKEGLEECYKTLSDWKIDTPKAKWKKDDNRTIRRWVIEAVREKKLKASKNPGAVPAWKESKEAINRNRELGAAAEKAYGSGSYQYIQASNNGVFFANHNKQYTKTLGYEMPTHVFIEEANRCLQALNAPLYFEENGTLRSR